MNTFQGIVRDHILQKGNCLRSPNKRRRLQMRKLSPSDCSAEQKAWSRASKVTAKAPRIVGFRYLLVAFSILASQPAFADFWVAVAVNESAGQHGNSYFLGSRSAATNSALANCRRFSGGADGCQVVLVTRRCSGMAHAGPNIYVSEGGSAGQAGSRALGSCEANHGSACRIHETFCPNQ